MQTGLELFTNEEDREKVEYNSDLFAVYQQNCLQDKDCSFCSRKFSLDSSCFSMRVIRFTFLYSFYSGCASLIEQIMLQKLRGS